MKRKLLWQTTLGVCLYCLTVCPASAVDHTGALTEDTLGTALVSTHRLPSSLKEGIAVQRMDTAAFRRLGVMDMAGALRRFAGINLRDYGGTGGMKTVSVRGLGPAHTVVSDDGLPVSDARNGQTDMGHFGIGNLQQLVFETAGSRTLLAPVATLSAAHIDMVSLHPDTSRCSGEATVHAGSFDTYRPYFRIGLPTGHGTAAGMSAQYVYSENDYPFLLHNGQATKKEKRSHNRTKDAVAELHFGNYGSGTWNTKIRYENSKRQLPGPVTYYTSKSTEQLDEQRFSWQAHTEGIRDRWQWKAAGKYDYHESLYADIDAQYPQGRREQDYREQQIYATAGVLYSTRFIDIAYATDYDHRRLRSNLSADHHVSRDGWLQALSARSETGAFILTARLLGHLYFQHRENGQSIPDTRRLTPEISALWQAMEKEDIRWTWRGYYQELFRVPSFSEAYYYHLGEHNLRPELSRQGGIGTSLFLTGYSPWMETLQLNMEIYAARISDRIVSVPYNLFIWNTTNVARVENRGMDITVEWTASPARHHILTFDGSYSFLRSRDKSLPGSSTYGNQQAYTPRHSGSASLSYENPWVNMTVHLTAASLRRSTTEYTPFTRLPGYGEMGIGLYKTFHLSGMEWNVRADCGNIFNKRYAIVRRYPMPGRTWNAGISLKW